jgi:hypothetical protein
VDVYPSIASFFQRHLEASSLAVDAIADTLGDAIELLAQAILADRKLFSIGLGADRASATALTSLLQHGILRERPSLPVVELATHQIDTSELGVGWVSPATSSAWPGRRCRSGIRGNPTRLRNSTIGANCRPKASLVDLDRQPRPWNQRQFSSGIDRNNARGKPHPRSLSCTPH